MGTASCGSNGAADIDSKENILNESDVSKNDIEVKIEIPAENTKQAIETHEDIMEVSDITATTVTDKNTKAILETFSDSKGSADLETKEGFVIGSEASEKTKAASDTPAPSKDSSLTDLTLNTGAKDCITKGHKASEDDKEEITASKNEHSEDKLILSDASSAPDTAPQVPTVESNIGIKESVIEERSASKEVHTTLPKTESLDNTDKSKNTKVIATPRKIFDGKSQNFTEPLSNMAKLEVLQSSAGPDMKQNDKKLQDEMHVIIKKKENLAGKTNVQEGTEEICKSEINEENQRKHTLKMIATPSHLFGGSPREGKISGKREDPTEQKEIGQDTNSVKEKETEIKTNKKKLDTKKKNTNKDKTSTSGTDCINEKDNIKTEEATQNKNASKKDYLNSEVSKKVIATPREIFGENPRENKDFECKAEKNEVKNSTLEKDRTESNKIRIGNDTTDTKTKDNKKTVPAPNNIFEDTP